MSQLDTVLIKTASRCNLDCSYCYVYQGADTSWLDQPVKMSDETINSIVDGLIEYSEFQESGFAIVLHGGEPLLLGKNKLELLLNKLRSKLPHNKYPISIQTNGILITESILNLCHKYNASLSVSIDGTKEANDIARLDRHGKSSFTDTLDGIKKLRNHVNSDFLFAGTLTVIQPTTNPVLTYDFLKFVGSPNIDFLYQDGNLEKLPNGKLSFSTTEYGNWLVEIFDLYINDPNPVQIRILDDLIKILIGGSASKEGKGEHDFGILVIESNGEIRKNDTLRASFEGVDYFYGRPNIKSHSIKSIIESEEFKSYVRSPSPTSNTCKTCEFLHICGGGMPLYRWNNTNGFDNPSVYCEDHKVVIKHIANYLKDQGILPDEIRAYN